MHVQILTETEVRKQCVNQIGVVKGSFGYHPNDVSNVKEAEQEGSNVLCRKAEAIGGDIIVFDPHVEMPPCGGSSKATLLMSALVFQQGNEM